VIVIVMGVAGAAAVRIGKCRSSVGRHRAPNEVSAYAAKDEPDEKGHNNPLRAYPGRGLHGGAAL